MLFDYFTFDVEQGRILMSEAILEVRSEVRFYVLLSKGLRHASERIIILDEMTLILRGLI